MTGKTEVLDHYKEGGWCSPTTFVLSPKELNVKNKENWEGIHFWSYIQLLFSVSEIRME